MSPLEMPGHEPPPWRILRVGSMLAILGVIGLVSSGCASSPKLKSPLTRPPVKVGTTAEGTASWYGPGYDGKRTACGERFDQDALTAAHGTWPCGTMARVTLLSTGKSVVVRVNDLFPNHKGRLIDVSRGAARQIGLIGPGTGKVRVEVVN